MRIRVDADLCTGHGRCYTHAPAVFEPDEEGYNAARGETVDVTPGHDDAARTAVDTCPERALSVAD